MNPCEMRPTTTSASTRARATPPGPHPLDASPLLDAEYVDVLDDMAASIYADTRDSLSPPPLPRPMPGPISPVGQFQFMEALRQQYENNIVMMANHAQCLAEMERQLAASGRALWHLAAAHGVNAGDGEKARSMNASAVAARGPLLRSVRQRQAAPGDS